MLAGNTVDGAEDDLSEQPPSRPAGRGHKRKLGAAAQQHQHQAAQNTDSTTAEAAAQEPTMRLGGRLTGRVVTRSKARGGEGFSSDSSDLLSAVLQQPASDPSAPSKGDLTRKPAPQVPGQVSIHAAAAVVASTRAKSAAANGVATPAAAPAPLPAPPASRHRRTLSNGKASSLQLQSDVANDLACIADTLVAACADPVQQQDGDDDFGLPAVPAALQRRSARLAADSSANSKALARASAPSRQQRRTPAAAAASNKQAPQPAAAAAAPATDSSLAQYAQQCSPSSEPSPGAASSQGVPGRRVRFADGPLNPQAHPNSTDDGHPASEGALAVPVRRVPVSYGMDLSRGNVLMLEQLLGAECSMSVTRLKRRVGLLPPIRPPRPFANNNSSGGSGAAAAAGQPASNRRA